MKLDILIKNGFVVDGTGGSWFRSDVGVKDGKIVEILYDMPTSGADRIIDAKGLVVCPGFFDMHTHSELLYFLDPQCDVKIRQGVTTDFNCQCGYSYSGPLRGVVLEDVKREVHNQKIPIEVNWTTLAEYMDRLKKFGGVSVNSAYMVGFGTVKMAVLGWELRPLKKDEMDDMKALVEEAMIDGAFGISTGLQYPPQNFAETDEVIELAKIVAKYGGIHQSHIRRQGFVSDPKGGRAFLTSCRDTHLEAVRECIEIGEKAGIPTVWTHAKAISGWKLESRAEELLREVDNARKRGVDVTLDHWANAFNGIPATHVLPLWIFDGGYDNMQKRLKDPEIKSKIRNIVKENLEGNSPQIDFRNGVIYRVGQEKNKPLIGKTLDEIARTNCKELVDQYLDIVTDDGSVEIAGRFCSDEDVIIMMKHPSVYFGTDCLYDSYGITAYPEVDTKRKELMWATWYGMYPRILRTFVREMKVITLEEAIRKMTSAPANRLGLMDRGLIKPGMCADITIFDPLNIREQDRNYPEGIPYVLVNGNITVDNGAHTGVRAGKILKHKLSSPFE